jgi:hypothetical protein
VLLVWFVATVCYVVMDIAIPTSVFKWIPFAWAVPVSFIVWLVFNSIWFNRRTNYAIISMLTWSALIGVVVTLFAYNVRAWQILLLGIPGQIIIFIWSRLQYHQR